MDEIILTKTPAIQHSQNLENHIKEQIRLQSGPTTFSDFMQMALYTPGLGYYSNGTRKFGAGGDFVTAPEIGPLFAQCVALQFAEILVACNGDTILELGAGSGQFACDVLQALHTQNVIIKNYLILELSADLRARQQEKILDLCPNFAHKVKWLDHLPQTPINGVIFANEVMDAMPVARFQYADDCLQEYYVAIKNDDLCAIVAAPTTALADAFAANRIADYISQPYTSEINLCLPAWVNSLNACLSTGAILLCDYGFPRAEYYHPQRDQGTFMCHYQHTCHDNAFINIGLQDLTAHVDFTSVAEAAFACGLTIGGYTNMASFLLNCGITEFITQPTVQQAQEVNTLTSPAEMGELFKCIMLTRDVDLPLLGFARYDKSSRL